MDEYLRGSLDVMGHGGEIVSLGMPDDFADDLSKIHLDHCVSETIIILESPFNVLFFFIACLSVKLILFLPLDHALFSLLIKDLAIELCLDYKNKFLVNYSQKTVGFTWAPFKAIDNCIRKLILS